LAACLLTLLTADPLWASSGALGVAAPATSDVASRTVSWPPWRLKQRPALGVDSRPATPHPAVARIIVPEEGATAYGSGTLVDVRDQYGLVVTNWHVVRDSTGVVDVVFPNGFRSRARPLKVDSDWDLAALVIWRPPIEPVQLADRPPRPGDLLTIHGYGSGQYRIATGRCTSYYSPRIDFPQEMVELDVEARQGDSGGPIFNDRGQLAGVLFGAGQGTTIGSFGPRVQSFLASLAPDIGAADEAQVAVADRPAPDVHTLGPAPSQQAGVGWTPTTPRSDTLWPAAAAGEPPKTDDVRRAGTTAAAAPAANESLRWQDIAGSDWFERAKTLFALVGVMAVVLQLVKAVR
jgi:S1-C subfamily serine protease